MVLGPAALCSWERLCAKLEQFSWRAKKSCPAASFLKKQKQKPLAQPLHSAKTHTKPKAGTPSWTWMILDAGDPSFTAGMYIGESVGQLRSIGLEE